MKFNKKKLVQSILSYAIIILSANSIAFFRDFKELSSVVYIFVNLFIIISFFIAGRWVLFTKQIIAVLAIFIIYNVFVTIKYGAFHPRFFLIYFNLIFFSYITVKVLSETYFRNIENSIYVLSLISFPFYLWGIVSPSTLVTVLEPFGQKNFSEGSSLSGTFSLFFFVFRPDYTTIVLRNSGFCWEPGFFAVLINLAILYNLLVNKFVLSKRILFYILLIVTTQSTTGLTSLLFLALFYIYNTRKDYSIFILPLIIAISILVSTLPFMRTKIMEALEENPVEIVENSYNTDALVHPQRFASFRIAIIDFYENPILGYGGHLEDRWFLRKSRESTLSVISGIGNYLATFGLFGVISFLFLLTKTKKNLLQEERIRGILLLFFLLLSFWISYGIFNNILFSSLLFRGYFNKKVSI